MGAHAVADVIVRNQGIATIVGFVTHDNMDVGRITGPWPGFTSPIAGFTNLTAALGIGSH